MPLWGLRHSQRDSIMLRMSEIARKPPSKPVRRKVDWDAVERDYRTTQLSLRELGARHGADSGAIARKAKRDEWARDLMPAVRQATNAALISAAISSQVSESQQNVSNAVFAAANQNTQVILGHRKGLQDITSVRNLLLSQVAQAAAQLPELAEVIEMLRQPNENGQDKANDAMRKAMGRSGLVDDLKKLAEIDERVRKGEREAFGIGSEVDDALGAKPKRLTVEFVDVVVK